MKLGKAIVSGIILYAVMFLAASAMLSIPEYVFGPVMVILSGVLTFFVSKFFYFKGMRITNPIKEGLIFGLVLIIVMFVIEVPVMVYGFAKDQGWNYFNSWDMILGYLLVLLIPILAAWPVTKRKPPAKKKK